MVVSSYFHFCLLHCFDWKKNDFFVLFMYLIRGQLLYNIVLVLPYINMNLPRVYTCSQSWTPLPPSSPYHPSGSFQCTSPKLPISCIEPGLEIRFLYDIIHVSMPFSQIIPPSLSHRVQYVLWGFPSRWWKFMYSVFSCYSCCLMFFYISWCF